MMSEDEPTAGALTREESLLGEEELTEFGAWWFELRVRTCAEYLKASRKINYDNGD